MELMSQQLDRYLHTWPWLPIGSSELEDPVRFAVFLDIGKHGVANETIIAAEEVLDGALHAVICSDHAVEDSSYRAHCGTHNTAIHHSSPCGERFTAAPNRGSSSRVITNS
jgi:hypothetical protein